MKAATPAVLSMQTSSLVQAWAVCRLQCHPSTGECHQGKHLPHRRGKENSPKGKHSAPFQWSKCSFINHLRRVSKPLSFLSECSGHSHRAHNSPLLPEHRQLPPGFSTTMCGAETGTYSPLWMAAGSTCLPDSALWSWTTNTFGSFQLSQHKN